MRAASLFTAAIVTGMLLGAGPSDPLARCAPDAAIADSSRLAAPTDDADPATRKVNGQIASLQQNVLVVKDKDGILRSFKTSSATTVTLDGKAATLAELRKGDQVDAVVGEMEMTTRITATRPKK